MTRANDLTPLLKRLQLRPMAATLPERIALARREQLDYASFLNQSQGGMCICRRLRIGPGGSQERLAP